MIIEYAGKLIKDSSDLPLTVARTAIGTKVNLVLVREKREVFLTVTITELKDKDKEVAAAAPEKQTNFGLTVQNVTPEIAQNLALERALGVVVTTVERGSAGDDAGIRRGDVILEVDRQPIRNLTDYRKAVAGLKKGQSALLLLQRGQETTFVALRVPTEMAP